MNRRIYRTPIVQSNHIDNDFAEKVELKVTQPPRLYKVQIIHSSLRKRSAPSIDAPVIGIISDEGIYTITTEQNEWG